MINQQYHYYKCHNLVKAPQPYAIYDYAKGAVGYNNKLQNKVVQSLGFDYLGYLTDKQLNKPVQSSKPAQLIKGGLFRWKNNNISIF